MKSCVREHVVDEAVDEARPGRDGLLLESSTVELIEHVAPEVVQAQMQLEEDVLLALEVVVQRRLRHAGSRSAISRSDVLSYPCSLNSSSATSRMRPASHPAGDGRSRARSWEKFT